MGRTMLFTAALAATIGAAAARAESFTNISGAVVDFPMGALSFADELVEFSPGVIFDPVKGANIPLPGFLGGGNTLGVPDMDLLQSFSCFDGTPTVEDCKFASLGSGGVLTVRFTDNLLTGSGNADADLWIFEAGPADKTFVDISPDGITWSSVGFIDGVPGVDLDAFGFGPGSTFSYVRLTDAPGGQTSGETLGADIDAIGAISTQAVTPVPLPATLPLLGSALGLLVGVARRCKRGND